MCLSANDAKNVVKIAEVVAPDNIKPILHAVDSSVHVNENKHLEVDVQNAVAAAQSFLK
jgi:hypothetical protein